jgi:NAD(P)-dependent dehydrogenase (short-subunit alcohol dehydrogenase family)
MGSAIAAAFARDGRQLIVSDLHAGPLETLASTLRDLVPVSVVAGDVRASD